MCRDSSVPYQFCFFFDANFLSEFSCFWMLSRVGWKNFCRLSRLYYVLWFMLKGEKSRKVQSNHEALIEKNSFFSLIAPQKAVYGGVYEVYVTKASRDTEILELVLKLDGIPYDELFNRAITIEDGTKMVSFDVS